MTRLWSQPLLRDMTATIKKVWSCGTYGTVLMLAKAAGLGWHASYLGDFTESSSFFSEVDDNTTASILSLLDGLLDAKNNYKTSRISTRHKASLQETPIQALSGADA